MNMKKSKSIVHEIVIHQGELQKWLLSTRLSSEYGISYRSMFIQLLKLRLTHGLETFGNNLPLTVSNTPE